MLRRLAGLGNSGKAPEHCKGELINFGKLRGFAKFEPKRESFEEKKNAGLQAAVSVH